MESVANNLSELENRRGNEGICQSISTSVKADGLAGFTATLIDAVTRLTLYVNEAEGKMLVMESKMSELKDQSDHQRALLDALTAELMRTQEQLASAKEARDEMRKNHDELKESVTAELGDLKRLVHRLQDNKNDEAKGSMNSAPVLDVADSAVTGDGSCDKEKEEEALKFDMLSLLGALKSQKPKNEDSEKPTSSGVVVSLNNNTTRNAAQTVASVESQLRHLKLQHVEAQNRLQEFSVVAGELAGNAGPAGFQQDVPGASASPNACSATPSIVSGTLTPRPGEEFFEMIPSNHNVSESVSSITITSSLLPNVDTSRPSLQSDKPAKQDPRSPSSDRRLMQDAYSVKSSDRVCLSDDSFHELRPSSIPLLLQQSNTDWASSQSEDGLKLLEKSLHQAFSALPPFKPISVSQPEAATRPDPLTASIKETQFNLEDRIADLNRQHAEAQARLQGLLKRRTGGTSPTTTSSSSGSSKVIQVTLPTEDMLKTPQVHKPPQPFQPTLFEGF